MSEGKRLIAVVTSSRADFGHLQWPLRRLRERPEVDTRLIAIAAHLSPEFGHTVDDMEQAGFAPDETVECLLSSDSDAGMAKTIGVAVLGLTDILARMRPDLLLLIADRYEMLAPATAALALRIPVAHIEGGDISEGAVDDAVRNALTRLSHLHFTPHEQARQRVLAMGEEAWRVHVSGAPSLDNLTHAILPNRAQLEKRLGLTLQPGFCVVAVHPVTLLRDTLAEIPALLQALASFKHQKIFCFPNADAGSRKLISDIRRWCGQHDDAALFVNLDHLDYWGLLREADLMAGNSSSGIMESPALALPCVDVGIRQQGRLRAANILHAQADRQAILDALEKAASPAFRESLQGMDNPWGDGEAGRRIADTLASVTLGSSLLHKRALPLASSGTGPADFVFRHD
ncbi:MAG: UDP-N-acetylglucosamine 2-epimerase [Gammaproteobacteria bacterium]|jgi:UDP-N-acetylglucosamine 2-epimerase (non-hydrolysing)/GDP/UDP-N,N'-diacetylbacillosamine 2-epimerase (hydrolysing)